MRKLRLAILRNEIEDDHLLWVKACHEMQERLDWEIVDLTRSDWFEKITGGKFDGLLAMPSGLTTAFRTMYEERIRILSEVCGMEIFPSLEEITIFENKKYFSYWLTAQGIPHPATRVFYHKNEALDYLKNATFPQVGKMNLGASGRGVRILKDRAEAERYVRNVFGGKVKRSGVGPNLKQKNLAQRIIKKLANPAGLMAKLRLYRYQLSEKQKQFVILQAFVSHEFEWRCVRIGDSFFAHKKLMKGRKASGSLLKDYDNPPLPLLDFVREITEKHRFFSQAVDIFESPDKRYLVNEMQCIFGQSDPYQMLVDGVPGRYRYFGTKWVFEAGDFNRYESFLLRLKFFVEKLAEASSASSKISIT